MSKLDDALNRAIDEFYDYITERDIIKAAYKHINKTVTKQYIKDLFLEVIDNPNSILIEVSNGKEINIFMDGYNYAKNQIRQGVNDL